MARIYLAGPDVFLSNAKEIGAQKCAICADHGLTGVFPLDADLDLSGLSKVDAGLAISRANEDLMRGCDAVIANMTPFRGPSMDVGTAFEMGFMRALGRPVFGYTNVPGFYKDKAAGFCDDGMLIEDFDMIDNLMMVGAAAHIEISDKSVDDLSVFIRCVERVASFLQ